MDVIEIFKALDFRRVLREYYRSRRLQLFGQPESIAEIASPERGPAGKIRGSRPELVLQREIWLFLLETEVPPFSGSPAELILA